MFAASSGQFGDVGGDAAKIVRDKRCTNSGPKRIHEIGGANRHSALDRVDGNFRARILRSIPHLRADEIWKEDGAALALEEFEAEAKRCASKPSGDGAWHAEPRGELLLKDLDQVQHAGIIRAHKLRARKSARLSAIMPATVILHSRGWMLRRAIWLLFLLFFVAGLAPAQQGQQPVAKTHLKVGDRAPDFQLKGQNGQAVKLSKFRGKKNVVLAFYVLAFTGG